MPESKKVVIKLDIHDEKDKRKALKAVSGLSGIESLAMDLSSQKLTVIGDVDPVEIVGKLKKWYAEIVTVGPAKEEKKGEDKKGDEKKGDEKKGNEEEEKKKKEQKEREEAYIKYMAAIYGYGYGYGYRGAYNHPYQDQRYCLHPVEEGPGGCVIC